MIIENEVKYRIKSVNNIKRKNMEQTIIETEIRAEVLPQDFEKIRKNIEKNSDLISHTKRLSAMSNKNKVEENRKQLLMFAKNLGLKILNSEKEFDELCNRLDINIDWPFHATDKDYLNFNS